MKNILGHKSRDQGEIIAILERQGTYTCPTLPHYRYDKVKRTCRLLGRLGLVRVTGRNPESVNLGVTPLFHEWKAAKATGETEMGPVRWVKQRRAAQQREARGDG